MHSIMFKRERETNVLNKSKYCWFFYVSRPEVPLHALQWQSLVSNDRGPSCTWTLLKWCIIEGGCNTIRHWSNKMKHFKWTRKTHPFTSPDDCAWTILPIVPCVWFRKDFIKDSNGHLQCKTRSFHPPVPLLSLAVCGCAADTGTMWPFLPVEGVHSIPTKSSQKTAPPPHSNPRFNSRCACS